MKILLVCISVILMAISVNSYRFNYGLKDSFFRTIMFPFEGTVWSKDFSEEGFDKITIGNSMDEVNSLIGVPVSSNKDCSYQCFWYYTWHDSGTADFDQRWVVFGKEKKVIEIRKSFFID